MKGWLVFDPDEEGAICVVAEDREHAWREAAPMLGEEGESIDATDYVVECLSSEDAAKFWQERADLLEALYGILRIFRPPRNIHDADAKPLAEELSAALDEAARVVSWHDAPGKDEAVLLASRELQAAGEAMQRLMANLNEAVPWHRTFALDVALLDEAPRFLDAALNKARGSGAHAPPVPRATETPR